MADIELVIKIPEEMYQNVVKNGFIYDEDGKEISHAIINGTVLSQGHGRLGDLDALAHEMLWAEIDNLEDKESVAGLMLRFCDKAQSIIDADRESEDKE